MILLKQCVGKQRGVGVCLIVDIALAAVPRPHKRCRALKFLWTCGCHGNDRKND